MLVSLVPWRNSLSTYAVYRSADVDADRLSQIVTKVGGSYTRQQWWGSRYGCPTPRMSLWIINIIIKFSISNHFALLAQSLRVFRSIQTCGSASLQLVIKFDCTDSFHVREPHVYLYLPICVHTQRFQACWYFVIASSASSALWGGAITIQACWLDLSTVFKTFRGMQSGR